MTDTKTLVLNENLALLANAVELGSRVILDIAGNEVSNSIDGQEVTLSQLNNAVSARLKSALMPATGG